MNDPPPDELRRAAALDAYVPAPTVNKLTPKLAALGGTMGRPSCGKGLSFWPLAEVSDRERPSSDDSLPPSPKIIFAD